MAKTNWQFANCVECARRLLLQIESHESSGRHERHFCRVAYSRDELEVALIQVDRDTLLAADEIGLFDLFTDLSNGLNALGYSNPNEGYIMDAMDISPSVQRFIDETRRRLGFNAESIDDKVPATPVVNEVDHAVETVPPEPELPLVPNVNDPPRAKYLGSGKIVVGTQTIHLNAKGQIDFVEVLLDHDGRASSRILKNTAGKKIANPSDMAKILCSIQGGCLAPFFTLPSGNRNQGYSTTIKDSRPKPKSDDAK